MTAIEDSLVFAIFPNNPPSRPRRRRRTPSLLRSITIEGKTTRLSNTEYRLLAVLARDPGKTVDYSQLYREVFADRPIKNSHHLRMYIRLLRRRIEPNPAEPRYVLTVRKRGYRLAIDENKSLGDFHISPALTSPPPDTN